MSRTIIYVIAVFALWLYFKYGNFGATRSGNGFSSQHGAGFSAEAADQAKSGFGGVRA